MAFTRPEAGVGVSAEEFGQPVYDALKRTGGRWRRVANQNLPAGAVTQMIFDTEDEDTGGFLTPPGSTITIPAGLGGLYVIVFSGYLGTVTGDVQLVAGGLTSYGAPSVRTGSAVATLITPLTPGNIIQASVWQNTAAPIQSVGWISLYRVNL